MTAYRHAADVKTWAVTVVVRGPLGPVPMSGHVAALDERTALERFAAALAAEGFEIVRLVPPSF